MKPYQIWHIGGDDVRLRIPLLVNLRKAGFVVGAVGSETDVAFRKNKIECYTYPLKRGLRPLADLKSLYVLVQLFRKHKPDIVHAFDTKPGLIVPIASMLSGVPIVVRTIAGMGYVFSSNDLLALTLKPVYHLLQKVVSAMTDVTIFQNRDDSAYFLKHRMAKKACQRTILSSGIDLEQFGSEKIESEKLSVLRKDLCIGKKIVIILVTRLVKDKGINEYMEAARIIRQKYHDTIFLLVGPRESEGKQAVTESLIKKYSNDVVYLGRREDIRELLRISNIFVLPSYYREGVPRVLLEAGAMGLPIITTDMPGCRDVVKNGWNGLLIPIRDAKALVKSIEWLINHKEQHKLMGERSKYHIRERFSLDLVTDAYANVYKKLLRNCEEILKHERI